MSGPRRPAAPRSPRTAGRAARTPRPDSPPGETPILPPAARAACAAARLAGPFPQHSGLLEKRADRIARERALVEPCPRLFRVDLEDGRIGARVVVPDRRHEAPVPRGALVGDHDPEVALPLPAHAPQPNASRHMLRSFSVAASSAGTVPAGD